MAEKTKEHKQKESPEKQEKKRSVIESQTEILVRIYGYDIPGSKNIYTGLTRIKGISWAIANALCLNLNYARSKKIQDLSKDEIKKIEDLIENLDVPDYMKNRRSDRDTGKSEHFYGSDLDMKREFDIKRLKEIKSYKGVRHALKLPVRGQRTRSHFRAKKVKATGKKAKVEKK